MATKKNVPGAEKTGDVIFTENAIVITLNAADKKKAMKCLEKNKKITFSFESRSITKLPQIVHNMMFTD